MQQSRLNCKDYYAFGMEMGARSINAPSVPKGGFGNYIPATDADENNIALPDVILPFPNSLIEVIIKG